MQAAYEATLTIASILAAQKGTRVKAWLVAGWLGGWVDGFLFESSWCLVQILGIQPLSLINLSVIVQLVEYF